MKRKAILGIAVIAVLGLSGCGKKELSLVSDQIEVELGSTLNETVTNYVKLDGDAAAQAAVDFSAVDVMKTGTYSAVVTYNEQTVSFEVIVTDTTAPAVEAVESVSVAAGEPLYTKDVITSVTELSGAVETGFQMVEEPAAERIEGTEAVAASQPETEGTEEIEAENEAAASGESFLLNDVLCNSAFVIYTEVGEYDNVLVVSDTSGNRTEVPVRVVVGTAPTFEGVEDITVTVGEEDVNYLDGVTATDCNGNDITGQIVCDTSAVNLKAEGAYDIVYTVADENGFQAEAKASVMVEKEKAGSSSKKTTAGTDSSTKKSSASGNSNKSSGVNNTTNNNTSGGSSATPNTGGSSSSTSGGNNSTSGGSSPAPSTDTTNNNTSGGSADTNSGTSGGSADTSGNESTPSAGTDGNSGTVDENQAMQDQLENGGFEEYVPEPGTGADDGSGMEGATGIR